MDQRTVETRTPEPKKLDTMHPPASPEQYSIRYGRPNGVEMTQSPELKQFDQSARARLSGAQFDRVTGNSLVTTI